MRLLLLSVFLFISLFSKSQVKNEVVFQAELFNRHYWRGFVFGDAPAIEPQATIRLNRFEFNIWAAHTFNDSYAEIDLIPSYTFGNYTVSLYDYYNPVPGAENRYFDFSEGGNRHSGEISIAREGTLKLPIHCMVATFFYGDRHPEHNTPMFSTYLQATYPFMFAGTNAELSFGISPWESFYSERFALVHSSFSLHDQINLREGVFIPITFSLNANPSTREAWVIFSLGIVKHSIP
jgi:hypothetical protein